MMTPAQIQDNLCQFIGTTGYTRLSPTTVLTDGVLWLCENAECYWLAQAIDSHQPQCRRDEMLREMQFWTLRVNADHTAVLTCDRDEGDTAITQRIPFTDFPLNEIRLWVEPLDERQVVILLPSEH